MLYENYILFRTYLLKEYEICPESAVFAFETLGCPEPADVNDFFSADDNGIFLSCLGRHFRVRIKFRNALCARAFTQFYPVAAPERSGFEFSDKFGGNIPVFVSCQRQNPRVRDRVFSLSERNGIIRLRFAFPNKYDLGISLFGGHAVRKIDL